MTNIFESLRADHEIQRDLITKLTQTTGESTERKDLFARLKIELEAHANCEERHFYVPLMKEDATQDKARHSVAEHKELDDFIEALEGYEMDGPQWLQTARDLEHRLLHHLEEEEHEVFQMAGKVLTESKKAELASAYESEMTSQRADARIAG